MSKRLLPIVAAAAMALAGVSAQAAFLPFQVTETSIPGALPNVINNVGKINGTYTEALTITGANTFAAQATADFGQLVNVNGAGLISQINNIGVNGYGLYAVFSASGTFVGTTFTGLTAAFSLYADPSQNTTKSVTTGLAAPILGGTADDFLLASSSTLFTGTGDTIGPPGAFDFIFNNFLLTAAGMAYFTDPIPFYMSVQVNGDIDGFLAAPGQTSLFTGDVSANFLRVPEPATLAIVGLGLLGVGLTRRRKAD